MLSNLTIWFVKLCLNACCQLSSLLQNEAGNVIIVKLVSNEETIPSSIKQIISRQLPTDKLNYILEAFKSNEMKKITDYRIQRPSLKKIKYPPQHDNHTYGQIKLQNRNSLIDMGNFHIVIHNTLIKFHLSRRVRKNGLRQGPQGRNHAGCPAGLGKRFS